LIDPYNPEHATCRHVCCNFVWPFELFGLFCFYHYQHICFFSLRSIPVNFHACTMVQNARSLRATFTRPLRQIHIHSPRTHEVAAMSTNRPPVNPRTTCLSRCVTSSEYPRRQTSWTTSMRSRPPLSRRRQWSRSGPSNDATWPGKSGTSLPCTLPSPLPHLRPFPLFPLLPHAQPPQDTTHPNSHPHPARSPSRGSRR
jgi:hypothetical protein